MARDKWHRKNDANTGTVSQELVKDKSTLESVAHNDYSGGGGADVVVIFVNVSMGRHFPRSLGYMSRLGMGFIQVSSQFNHKHPRFIRLRRRCCPNSTGECNQ
jgi:hypothetical protein